MKKLSISKAAKPLALALCAISLTACATPSQVYWDSKVKTLCEKDGGVTVYEKIELTKEEYEKLNIPFDKEGNLSTAYYRVSLGDVVINEDPKVRKGGQKIIRRSDSKVLGMQIYYGRSGGDVMPLDNPSHYGCEDMESVSLSLTKSIFFIKGE